MNETTSNSAGFRTVLREQKQRVVAAIATEGTVDASPIIRDDEVLSCEEYVTLVYELYHVHLPELEAAHVIEFNRREETVRRGARFDETLHSAAHSEDR